MIKLRSGHIIRTRNGNLYAYFDENSVFGQEMCVNLRTTGYFKPRFNKNLKDMDDDDFSVVEVYKPAHFWANPNSLLEGYKLELRLTLL